MIRQNCERLCLLNHMHESVITYYVRIVTLRHQIVSHLCELLTVSSSFYFPSCLSAPGPVASFSGWPVSPTQVMLTWSLPLTPNGIITGYKITTTSSSYSSTSITVSSATCSYKLHGLHSNTRYTFAVAAVNVAGPGQATTIVIHTL